MTTPTKRSAKAKKLWAYPYEDGDVVTDVPPSKHDVKRGFCRPVFLLPAATEDVEAMREAVAKALWEHYGSLVGYEVLPWKKVSRSHQRDFKAKATAALTALNLSTPAKNT